MTMQSWGIEPAVAQSPPARLHPILGVSLIRSLPAQLLSPMQPIFGPSANTELSLIERTLLRQANLRASERCALADVDLKAHLTRVSSITGNSQFTSAKLPPELLASLRVSVEDFTSNARALYPSAEELLLSLKHTVTDAVGSDDANARDFIQTVIGWAIEAYFAR